MTTSSTSAAPRDCQAPPSSSRVNLIDGVDQVSNLDQGQMSTCQLHAFAVIFYDMCWMRYQMAVEDPAQTRDWLKRKSTDTKSSLHMVLEKGASLQDVITEVNKGNASKKPKDFTAKFTNDGLGRTYCIKVKQGDEMSFAQVKRLLKKGDGKKLLYVRIKTDVGGHGFHAVAAFRISFDDRVWAWNSWGPTKPEWEVTEENMLGNIIRIFT